MRSLLLTVFALLVATTANVNALKCYSCTEVGDNACSKSKLEDNKAKYSKDCDSIVDRCMRQETETLGIKGVFASCATESSCSSFKSICDNLDTCKDVACCTTDNCNGGSAVYVSMFLVAVCCVVGLVIVK